MGEKRLVVFDLGRVLVRICDDWRHACEVAGIAVPADVAPPCADARARIDAVVRDYDTGRIDQQTFAARIASARGSSAEQITKVINAYLLGTYEGAAELIDDIHAAGHDTACLSNTNADHWRMMTDARSAYGSVLSRLKHRFGSHLVGARKPDPAIYARLETATGAAPRCIVFFDDMEENVLAARQRGWTAHVVPVCENPISGIREILRRESIL